ncbi:MAG TPA: GNAT family protein [Ktedonobacterales bacterium]|jgi:RimJ/RimL family protein N-acetyltransferase
MLDVQPVTLEGALVRLEPLSLSHAEGLLAAAQDPAIWRHLPAPMPQTIPAMRAIIEEALQARAAGKELPFAIVERASLALLGSTRYLNILAADRGLEIGWTWLTPRVQRTGVNTECKYLLLRHAFETLGAIRVQLKTDRRNVISQRAIERLGAVKEGILRKHMVLYDGYQRDTVFYSILDDEWPTIKAGLEAKM